MLKSCGRSALLCLALWLSACASSGSMFESQTFGGSASPSSADRGQPAAPATPAPAAMIPPAPSLIAPGGRPRVGVLNLSETVLTHVHIGTTAFANFISIYPHEAAPLQQMLSVQMRQELAQAGFAAVELTPPLRLRDRVQDFFAPAELFKRELAVNPELQADLSALMRAQQLDTLLVAVPLLGWDETNQRHRGFAIRSRSLLGFSRVSAWPSLRVCVVDQNLKVRTATYGFFQSTEGVSFLPMPDIEPPGKDAPLDEATRQAWLAASRQILARLVHDAVAQLKP